MMKLNGYAAKGRGLGEKKQKRMKERYLLLLMFPPAHTAGLCNLAEHWFNL